MKKKIYILLIIIFITTSCKKDSSILSVTTYKPHLPFENNNIRLELVTSSAPKNIREIYFFNATTGIAVTYDGKIYKTTNNGASWNAKYINPTSDQPFYQILFVDENIGYVVGGSISCYGTGCIPSGGLILKTTDGGNTWTSILEIPNVAFISIASNSNGELFTISNGSKGRIYKSNNAGVSWTTNDSVDFQLQKISFSNGFGFCTGTGGKIIRSTNNGKTWNITSPLIALYATDIKFNNEIGFYITDNETLYKTTNNGNSWTQIFNHQYGSYILNPLTENSCLVFGAGAYSGGCVGSWDGKIIQTKDAGINWTTTEINSIEPISSTSFYSTTEGYAVAGNMLLQIKVK